MDKWDSSLLGFNYGGSGGSASGNSLVYDPVKTLDLTNNSSLVNSNPVWNMSGSIPAVSSDSYLKGLNPAGGSSPSLLDGFLGTPEKQGWGGLAIGTAGGIGNLFMGMQQYGLAKQALATTKEQLSRNYEAQKVTTNAELQDRQRARVASNPGAYVSVSDYMKQNGIN